MIQSSVVNGPRNLLRLARRRRGAESPAEVVTQGRSKRHPSPRELRVVLAIAAVGALVAGLLVGASGPSDAEHTAEQLYTGMGAWATSNRCTTCSRRRRSRPTRSRLSGVRTRGDAATSTAKRIDAGGRATRATRCAVPMTVDTRAFGTVRADLVLPLVDDGVLWIARASHFQVYPEASGSHGSREHPSARAILARDGRPIVEGPARARRFPQGEVEHLDRRPHGRADDDQDRRDLYARGFPSGAPDRSRRPRARARARGRRHARRRAARGAAVASRPRSRARRGRCAPRSTWTCRRPRSPRSPAASAASRRSTRATDRCARWRVSPSPRRSRRGWHLQDHHRHRRARAAPRDAERRCSPSRRRL